MFKWLDAIKPRKLPVEIKEPTTRALDVTEHIAKLRSAREEEAKRVEERKAKTRKRYEEEFAPFLEKMEEVKRNFENSKIAGVSFNFKLIEAGEYEIVNEGNGFSLKVKLRSSENSDNRYRVSLQTSSQRSVGYQTFTTSDYTIEYIIQCLIDQED